MPRQLPLMALLGAPLLGLASMWQDTPPSTLVCTSVAAPSDTGSGRIGLFAIGARGRLAWTEGRVRAPQIRDVGGGVRSAGRAGGGPGEFAAFSGIGWSGDTLWVADPVAARVQYFSESGDYLTGVRTAPRVSWRPRPDGRFVGFAASLVRPSPAPYVVMQLTRGSTVADTLYRFPRIEPTPVLVPAGDREIPNPHPLLPRTVVAASSSHSRFCATQPDGELGTRIRCIDDRGSVRLDRRVAFAPRPLTNAVYDSVVARFSLAPGRTPALMRDRIERPRNLPPVGEMLVLDDGQLWLRRSSPFEPESRWARLDSAGRGRPEVVFPSRHRLLAVRGDSAWVAIPDANDLEEIAGCRVMPGR